ncbi:MAG: tRNA uridine-5-carboxymethylaminomethyl(34) synthesis GTPase MnmE [Elusimicrobia bacterium RIFOXYB2_FULL_50_12]|nr:MAG: tRNA uridine-5-carboxymethylaminomethyl(34) synthesis GTPase MnmE [Elusimicrobia bacterium RIFOXYB2_FULL_50_12]
MQYNFDDTIAAVATPAGRSGIGIVRVSGRDALKIVENVVKLSRGKSFLSVETHTIHHGWVRNAAAVIDEVLVNVMCGPHSYTGEDTAEISGHGNSVTLRRILELCLGAGARMAGPGEFTYRAFVNGRLDLAKAEAVADLIAGKTERAARAAANQLQGTLSNMIGAWRAKLLDLAARVEAALDYAEEDISFATRDEIRAALEQLAGELAGLRATAARGRILREGARVAIVGAPNTGKSSLLNALLLRERSIVTDIAGTTRDLIEESLDIGGIPVVIIDTAGLRRHTDDPVEKIGLERTAGCMAQADIILWILDSSRPFCEHERHIGELLGNCAADKKILLILNKCDLPPAITRGDAETLFPGAKDVISISALNRIGLETFERALALALDAEGPDEPVLVNARQGRALEQAGQAASNALEALDADESEELIAFHLREALNALGNITGETTPEEILSQIFEKFCVGK